MWKLLFIAILVVEITAKKMSQFFENPPERDIVIWPSDYCDDMTGDEEWDFIVVGAGAAGCAVARRLAEIEGAKVLLLEAGGNPPRESFLPFDVTETLATHTWRLAAVPTGQECRGIVFNSCLYNPGKGLGGGSLVYYLMYVRGNKKDFDEWSELGNKGWSFDEVLPYFKKFENFNATPSNSHYHSVGGPLTISNWNRDPLTENIREDIFKEAENLGFERNIDINTDSQIGPTSLHAIVDDLGMRITTARGYLVNAPDNLKVCKNSMVTKINLSKNKVAESVTFIYKDLQKWKLKAKKEIILCAGALNSPQILERSGIGRKDILKKAGVELKHKLLGVGENLQDHYVNLYNAFIFKRPTSQPVNPLTNGPTSFTFFFNTANHRDPVPDVQFYLEVYEAFLQVGLGFKPNIAAQFSAASNVSAMLLYFSNAVMRQESRGYIHIWSTDPKSNPLILPNHFGTDAEIKKTLASVRFSRKLFLESGRFKKYGVKGFALEECSDYVWGSSEEIICGTRHIAVPINHPAGTCKMGPANDPFAVVSPRLKVHGIGHLRIADTSIFPVITRGNTMAPTIMVGEKAADMIKEDHGFKHKNQ